MRKDITGLIGFILFFVLVMFLPLIDFEIMHYFAFNDEFISTIITYSSFILIIPFVLKLQWLILILTVPKIKKHTKSLLLINLLTNLKLNYIILGLGVILDFCIFKLIPYFNSNWSPIVYRMLYLLYLSFTSNYIIIFLIVFLNEKNISIKRTVKNFLSNFQKRLFNTQIVKNNFQYLNQLKNILELVDFILFFVLVMFLPWINLTIFDYAFFKKTDSLLLLWAGFASIILIIPFGLKLQWLILIITVNKLRKITKNPLLIRLFNDLKLNKKIFLLGFVYDICACIYAQKFIWYSIVDAFFYWIYFSFTSNYFIVYLIIILRKNSQEKECNE